MIAGADFLRGAAMFGSCGLLLAILACSAAEYTPTVTIRLPTPTHTATPQPSMEPTPRMIPTAVPITHTATVAPSPTPTAIPKAAQTSTPSSTATPFPTPTQSSGHTSTATATPVPTPRPILTPTPAATPTALPTPTLAPVPATPTSTPTSTPTPFPDPTATTETSYFIDNADCENLTFTNRLPTVSVTLRYMDIELHVDAELADEPSERGQGLMCRSVIPDDTGMLFVFTSESTHTFWMFNTYVPLDIVYLDSGKLAVDSAVMSPCPRPEGSDDSEWRTKCTNESRQYRAERPARYALELPSGWLERVGIPMTQLHEVEFSW